MQKFGTPSPPSALSQVQARNTLRALYVLIASILLTAPLDIYLGVRDGAWQLLVIAAILSIIAVCAAYCIRLTQRGKIEQAVKLMLGSALSGLLPISLLIAEVGLVCGLLLVSLTFSITAQTVQPSTMRKAVLASIVVSILVGLIDLWGPSTQFQMSWLTTWTLVLVGLLLAAFTLSTIRQFKHLSLYAKLMVAFYLTALLPLSVMTMLNEQTTRSALINDARKVLLTLADDSAEDIDAFINYASQQMRVGASLPEFARYLQLPPEHRAGADQNEVEALLRTLAAGDLHPVLSYALLDPQGQNLADSDMQGIGQDEAQHPYANAPLQTGQSYISSVIDAPRPLVGYLYFSAPMLDEAGNVLGVLRARYDAAILQKILLAHTLELAGPSSFAVLLDEQGAQIVRDRGLPMPVTPDRSSDERMAQVAAASLDARPWSVAFFQSEEIFLATASQQSRVSIFLAIVASALAALVGMLIAQRVAHPITRLTQVAARVSAGDLSPRATIEASDEIGLLALTFNRMTEHLRHLIHSLETRVAERTSDLTASNDRLQQEILERRARERHLRLLNELTHAANSSQDLHSMLQALAQRVIKLIDADGSYIAFWDEKQRVAVAMISYKAHAETTTTPLPTPGHLALTEWVLREGHALAITDVAQSPHTGTRIAEGDETRSMLALPLITGERKLGAVLLTFDKLHAFTSDEIALGEQAANQIALAIAKAQLFEAECEQRTLAETLRDTAALLNSSLHFDVVLDRILASVQRVVPHDGATIGLLESGVVRFARSYGYAERRLEHLLLNARFPLADTPSFQYMIESGQPLVIAKTAQYAGWVDTPATSWVRSYAGAPIRVGDHIAGFLGLDSATTGFFTAAHAQHLQVFAEQAAVAIRNAQSFESAARRATELETLHQVSLKVTENLERRAVFNAILDASSKLLPGSHDAQIFLYDAATDRLTFGAGLGPNGPLDQPIIEPRLDGLIHNVAREGQPCIIDDLSQHPRLGQPPFEWRGMSVCVPLKIGGRAIGVMSIFHAQQGAIGDDELRIFQLLADQAAIAIENARLFETAEQRASELEALRRASLSLTGNLELKAVLDAILNATLKFLDGSLNAHIFLYDPANDRLTFGAALWTNGPRDEPFAEPRREGLTYRVAHQGKPLLIADMKAHPIYRNMPADWTGSMASLPLKIGQRVVGVMNVHHPLSFGIIQDDLRLIRLLADQAAIAIENANLYAEANRLRTFNENIVQNLDEGILMIDAQQRIVFVNPKTGYMLGYSTQELIGKQAAEIVDPDYRQQINREFDNRLQGIANRYETALLAQDGRRVPVILSAQPLFDKGNFSAVVVVVTDITERKQAEEALRESEAKLRAIVDNTNDVIYIKDREGLYLLVNPAGAQNAALTSDQIIGKTDLELWGLDIHKEYRETDEYVMATAQPHTFEWHKNGSDSSRVFLATKYPYRSARGDVIGVVGISRDITGRKQAQESLRQTQKLESLGILAGGVAHDFNNLLVAILGQTSLLQRKLPSDSPYRVNVDKAVKAAERAADLARKMLAYSGRGHLEVKPLNLNELLEENLHLFAASIPKATQLRSQLAEGLPLIEADAGEMQQVVMNLILNAAEAIGENPGAIDVHTDTLLMSQGERGLQTVTGDALLPGRYILLQVRDNGCGMDAETLSRIFDPFFTTKFTGRGLGLSAVLGIIRGHRGGLQVDSVVGEGTTFRLLFPVSVVTTPTEVVAPGLHIHAEDQQHGTILVIDDEEPVREAVTDILEMEGLRVWVAQDGETGIALYRERYAEIDLILLDHSMPGLNGVETLQRLKQVDPHVQVILSSGFRQEDIATEFESSDLAGFIQKPYDATTLINIVHEHIHRMPPSHTKPERIDQAHPNKP